MLTPEKLSKEFCIVFGMLDKKVQKIICGCVQGTNGEALYIQGKLTSQECRIDGI